MSSDLSEKFLRFLQYFWFGLSKGQFVTPPLVWEVHIFDLSVLDLDLEMPSWEVKASETQLTSYFFQMGFDIINGEQLFLIFPPRVFFGNPSSMAKRSLREWQEGQQSTSWCTLSPIIMEVENSPYMKGNDYWRDPFLYINWWNSIVLFVFSLHQLEVFNIKMGTVFCCLLSMRWIFVMDSTMVYKSQYTKKKSPPAIEHLKQNASKT